MAAHSGTAGSVVYVNGGTTVVGEIGEWSMDYSMSPVNAPAFGRSFMYKVSGPRTASGSFAGNTDPDDTPQTGLKNAVTGGSVVELRLYENVDDFWTIGSALLTSMGRSTNIEGKADISFSFDAIDDPTFTVG